MRLLSVGFPLFFMCATAAFAQSIPPAKPASGIVTILSDELSEPESPAAKVLNELSVTLDKSSSLRVLSVAGYGGVGNVRDLLQLRGTDLALINNDVLAYLDLAKVNPEARQKVRLVTPVYDQGVFLFARRPIKSIADMKGRKLGLMASKPSRIMTARTIFGLLKINVEFIALENQELATRVGADIDAVLLFERDLPDVKSLRLRSDAFHLISISGANDPLRRVYRKRTFSKASLGEFAPESDLETVEVTTLLASFDWKPKQARYGDVSKFVAKLFEALPKLRNRDPNSLLSHTDFKAELPDWRRFGPTIALAAAAPPLAIKTDNTPLSLFPSDADVALKSKPLRLSVVARPPLTDPYQASGGLIVKLFVEALAADGMPISIEWASSERTQLDTLLTDGTSDIGLFWQTPNCDNPGNLSANEATLCDRVARSEPLMQVLLGVFTRLDMQFAPKTEGASPGRSLCIPENQFIHDAALAGISWIKAESIKTLRPKTLIDCIAAVERRDADAFISIESEGRFTIDKLKLSNILQLSQHLEAAIGLHAIVAKDNPLQAQLLVRINQALSKFRSTDRYAAILTSHLSSLTGSSARE